MRLIHIPIAAAAFYLGLSISIAPAQQNQLSDPGQQQRHDNMIQTKPGQGGKEEPSSHAPTASETDIFVNGKLVVPGAPAESQTEPAKFSERNARIDAMPIMAYPLGLTDEQKRRIAESVLKSDAPVSDISAKLADILPADTPIMAYPLGLSDEQKQRIVESIAKSDAPIADISAKPADVLPAGTPVAELPADAKAAAPMTSDLHFIRTRDKILLVRATNMVVTGEIAAY
jgi:hypothetical protein